MKSKTAKNRKKNRRKKRSGPNKAEDIWREIKEQETLDSLDPNKNAPDSSLFVFDNALPSKRKLIKNKTTWAERKLETRGLGIVLPKFQGKSFQEKRKLSEAEKRVIDAKVKRLKGESNEVKKEVVEVKDEEGEEDDEEESDEDKGESGTVKEVVKKEETEDKKSVVIVKQSEKVNKSGKVQKTSVQVYDMWGAKPEPAKNPKQSFIEDILHPKQREFVYKPVPSKLPAVPISEAESYRPAPEIKEAVKGENSKVAKIISAKNREAVELHKKLTSHKKYFPRVDVNDEKDEGEGEEEGEPIREQPKRHKKKKEKREKTLKKIEKDKREKAEEFARQQREVYRAPDILESIEEEEKTKEEKRMAKLANRAKRFDEPRSTDGKKVKQPALTPLAKPSTRLRTLDAVVNPLKERLLSMKSRGLIVTNTNPQRQPQAQYRLVEPLHVREMMREDYEKYIKPILEEK